MKYIIIFVFVAPYLWIGKCDRHMILNQTQTGACRDVTFHVLTIVSEFFKDQDVLTVVRDYSEAASFEFDVYSCVVGHLNTPYVKYNNISTLKQHQPVDEFNYLSSPRSTYCYLVITDSFQSINNDIPALGDINSNAKFVFLFTNSTKIEAEMFVTSIWSGHKMKNCISIIISENESTEDSFDVNAVTFNPFAYDNGVRGEIVFYNINSSTFQKYATQMTQYIVEANRNYFGYPVKVYMYKWAAYSAPVFNKSNPNQILRYSLLDGELLNLFARHMNFTPIFIGGKNNSFEGSLRAIENNKADIASNSRIIANYNTEKTVFLRPIDLVELRYMVPKRHSLRALNVFVYSLFDFQTSLTMISVFIFLILIWFTLNFIHEKFTNTPQGNSIPRSLLIVTSTQYFISIKLSRFLKGHQQVLLGFMLIYGIIVSSNYQSSVVGQLSTAVSDDDINTLEKLRDSGLNIYFVPTVEQFIGIPENFTGPSIVYELFQKQEKLQVSVPDAAKVIANNHTIAVLCTSMVAYNTQSVTFDNKTGLDRIFVIPKSPVAFFNSYIVPKRSPYRIRFNDALFNFIEFGFVNYETEQVKFKVKIGYITRAKLSFEKGESLFMPISPNQMRSLFYVWGYLLTIAIFLFIIELLTQFVNQNQFNKLKLKV